MCATCISYILFIKTMSMALFIAIAFYLFIANSPFVSATNITCCKTFYNICLDLLTELWIDSRFTICVLYLLMFSMCFSDALDECRKMFWLMFLIESSDTLMKMIKQIKNFHFSMRKKLLCDGPTNENINHCEI